MCCSGRKAQAKVALIREVQRLRTFRFNSRFRRELCSSSIETLLPVPTTYHHPLLHLYTPAISQAKRMFHQSWAVLARPCPLLPSHTTCAKSCHSGYMSPELFFVQMQSSRGGYAGCRVTVHFQSCPTVSETKYLATLVKNFYV